ncbi:DinB family protein [Gracilibacillus saliphilus]|uniref:DinB family protein n=1 Tax=Gracilibacillus saliphilus TaxID=543890 RepID=UPI003B515C57
MFSDFEADQNMDCLVSILYAMVDENYQRLKTIVADMSQEEVDFKGPEQKYNSTAQLLRHLTFVDLNWVFRIKGESIPLELLVKHGPMWDDNGHIPEIKGISFDILVKDYDDIMSMLKSACLQLTDKQLKQIVNYGNGKQATIQWGIWHIADHNRYHQAHINQLRKWYAEARR